MGERVRMGVWDYPPRGGTHLTCGCWQPSGNDAFELLDFWDWDNGILCEFSGWAACPRHSLEIKVSGRLIHAWSPTHTNERNM